MCGDRVGGTADRSACGLRGSDEMGRVLGSQGGTVSLSESDAVDRLSCECSATDTTSGEDSGGDGKLRGGGDGGGAIQGGESGGIVQLPSPLPPGTRAAAAPSWRSFW